MLHVLFFFTYRTIFIGYSSNCEVTLINSFYEYSEMQDLTVAKNILVSGLDLGSLVVSAKTKLENARINRIESEGDSTERYIVGGYINYKPANISLTFHQLVSSLQTSGLGGIITQPNAINGADGDLYTNLKPEDIEEFVVNSFAKPSNEFADIMKKLISERSDLKENIEKAFDQIMFFAEDSDNSFISELAKSRIKANSHDDFIRSLLIRLDNKEQGIELKHSDNLVALIGDDPSSEGYVRATYFGPKGFTGHVTRPDYQSLLDLIASEGYVKDGTGSLERFAKLNSFSTGNEISSLIADVNSNRITFKEFINLSNDLSKDDDNPESASFDIDSFASPDRDTVLNLYQSIVDSDTSIHYGDSIRILIPGEDGDDRQILASVGKNNIVLNELVIPDDPTTPLQIINYVLDHFGNEVSRQSFGVEADTIQKLQDSGFRINKPIEIVLNSNLSFRAEFERQSHTNKHDSIFPVSGVINGESYNALVSCNSKSSGILNLRSIYMEDGDKRMFIEEGRLDSNNDYEIINPRKIAKAVDVAIFCKLNVSLPEYRASQNPLVTDFGYPENEVEDYVANPILGQGDFDNKDDYILQCLMHEDNFRSSLLKQALKKLEALNKPARYKNKTHYEWLSSLSNLSPSRKEALDDYVFAVGAIDTNNAQYQNRYDFAASEWDTFHSKHLNENLNSEYDFFQNWSAEQSRAQLSESQVKLLDYIDSAMESVGNHESAVIDYISGNHPKFFPKNILTTNSSGLGQIGAEIQKAIYYKDSLPLSDIVSSSSNQLKVESPQTVMKLEPEPDQLGSRLKNTIVNNAPETPLAANHDTFGDFYSALIDAKRTELNNKVAILELKLIALNLSEHPDLASSEFEEWAKSKSDDPVIAETLISYLSASDDLSKFNDTGHDALKLDAQNLWDNAHINSTASIADSMAGKGESKSSNKTIKDYGEKVPGAAKDRWVSYMINLNKHHDPELTSISKFLPSPNYQSLWKKGVSKEKLSLAALVISVVPTGRGITSRRQIKDQSTKAIHAKRILTQVINFDGDIKAIETSIIKDLVHSTGIPLDCISMHHDLFKGFEPEHYKKLSGFEISQQFGNMQSEPTFAMKYPGGEFAFRNSLSSLYQPRESFKPRILAAAKEFIDRPPVEKKPKITKFRVYTDRKTNLVYIGFELPNSSLSGKDRIVRLKEFGPEAKPKDGFQYISENRESLDKELNKLKNFELRKQFNKTRIGSQWRSDDISNKDLIETFGAKGVEFGNSLPENERQDKMNQVYDALCDLASVTNIDRKALGLNGNLTLGLATRGKGGKSPANASYFPYYRVINLTRNNGAGSLAHEMLHAIDHHYGIVGHESFDAINNAPADLSTSMATSAPPMKTNELRPEMREAFISLIDAISHPELVERYVKLDGFRKEPYLSKTIEIAARSFEKYVQLKLEEKNIVNEFLVNTNESHHSGSGFAYPSTEEMHKFGISDSFDNLFTQMKTLETDRGLALYKLDSKSDAINSEWLLNSALNISSFGNVNIDVDEISDALLKNEILASSVRHDFIDSRYPREHVINTYFIDFGSQQDIALFKQVATVYESEDKVWMEINNSSENEDALFRVLADYSLSSGKTFYGDPESDSAIHLENMLSSAIRHGTASHINPNGFINGSSDVVSWSFSDNQNLQSLLKGSQSNIFKMMPELSKFSFNPENSKYEIIQSDLEHPEKFLKISALINGDIHLSELYEREISYSEERLSTSNILKRVVLTSHLLELDPTQVFGSKIIENATNRLLTGPLSPTLPIDTTVAQVRRWIAPTELYTGTAIKIVKATRDLPGHLQRDINNSTPGVYDLSSNAPYIIADNIRDEEHAIKTALHEGLGHSGIISFLDRNSEMGGAEAFDVLDKIYSDIGPDEILRSLSSYSLDTNNVNDRRVAVLEYIAHLSEDISSSHMDDLINSNADLLNNLYQDVPVSWNKSEILGLIEASRINLVYEESIKRAATTGFDFSKGSPAYEHAFNSVLYDIGGLSNLLTKHSPDITTWHGTPSEVLKFDSSYIGTGEGAQSQGYGLYTTGSKEIGEIYQQRIANSQSTVSGVKYDIPELMNSYRFSDPEYSALDYYLKAGSNWIEAERLLNEDLETNTFYSVSSSEVTPELVKETMSRLEKFISPLSGRNLYQTKLSINFESMLDLDKPLTEQSIIVQNALKPYLGDLHIGKLAQDVLPQWKSEYLSQLESIGLDEQEIAAHSLAVDTIVYNDQDDEAAWSVLNRIEPSEIDLNLNSLYDITSTSGRNYFGNEVTGQYIYDQFEAKGLTSTPAQTSQLLSSIGIKGNKYLNGISRDSDTDKTIEDYNYVTFDDSNISISKTAEEVAIEESKSESQIAESQGIDVSQAASLKRAAVLGFPDTMYYLAKSESGVETYTKSVADSVSGGEVLLKFSKPYLADNQDSLNNIMSSPERLQVLKNSGFDSVVANEPQTAPVIAMFDSSQVAEANSLFISDILSVPEAAAQSTDYADTTEAIDPDTIFYVATMSKMTNIQLQEYGSPLGYGDYVDEAVFITNTPADAHSSLDLFADDLHVYPVVLKLDNSVISEDTSIEAYLSDYPVRDINTPNNRLLAFYQSTQEERLEYAHDQGYLKGSIPSESEVSDFGSPLVIRSITADLSLDVKPNIDEATGLDTSTEARLARAEEMGYDTSKVYYHGSDKGGFKEFEIPTTGRSANTGIFFSDNRGVAASYVSSTSDDIPLYTGSQIFEDPSLIDGLEVQKQYLAVDADGDFVDMKYEYFDSIDELNDEYTLKNDEEIALRYSIHDQNGYEVTTLETKQETINHLDSMEFETPGVYEVFLKKSSLEDKDNVLTIDWEYENWDASPVEVWHLLDANEELVDFAYSKKEVDQRLADEENIVDFAVEPGMNTNERAERAKEMGYAGVIFKNIYDNGSSGSDSPSDVYVVFDESNIRSVNALFDTSKEQLPNILLKSEHPQLDLEIQQHDVSLLPALLNNHELETSDLSTVISDSKGNNFGLSLSQSGWRSPKLVENYGEAAKNMPYATLSVPNNMSLSSSSTLLDIRQGLLDIGVVDLEVGNSKNLSMRDLNQVKQTLDIPISKPASNDTLHVELSPQSPELKAFSNARFLFAGSRSEYAPIKNLARAKAMYTENQSKEERSAMIRATGWHRGADNSWRYEIYDQNSSIHQGFLNSVKQNYQEKDVLTGTCKLREFFSHDSLYEHYPRLSELNVNFFTKHDSVSGSLGFDHSGGHSHINLYINDETSELELRKTLVHELQHYIQFVEGFAQGGNSSIDFLARSLQQAISRAELGINELVSSQWKSLVNENSAVEDIQIMEDLKALSTNPSAQEQAYKLFELDVFAVNEAKIRIAIGNPVDENQKEAFGAWVREAASELMKIHNHDFLYRNNKSIESKHEEIIENHGRRGLEKRQRLISEELTELKPEILRNSKLGDRLSTLRGLLNNLTPETAHKTYRAFGGEVEARLVSRRLHLPKSGRLRCDPIEMMDVHKNNHINIRDFPVSFTAPMSLDVIDERLSLSGVDKKAVEIVQSHNELPLELSNISKEYNQVPAGANFNGKIYLVADQLNDVSQIDEALIHEMAHGGVKTVFGSELSSSYENFWNKAGGEKGMHDLAVENGVGLYQYSAPAQDLVDSGEITAMQRKTMLVDEFVAHMVTNQQNQTFTEKAKTLVSEFIGSIRNSLRKTGLMNSATMTNSDIAFTVKAVSDASRGKFHEQPLVINNTESLATTAKRSWSWLNKVREISQSIPGALNLVNSFTNSNTKTAIDSMASYKTPRLGMINMIEDRSPESFKSIFPINPMQKNDEVRYLTTSGTINHQLHSVEQRDDRIYDLSMMNELASTQDPISIPRDEGGEVRVELLDNNLIKAVVIDTNGQEIGIATGPGVTSTIEIANKSAEPEIYQGRSMRM